MWTGEAGDLTEALRHRFSEPTRTLTAVVYPRLHFVSYDLSDTPAHLASDMGRQAAEVYMGWQTPSDIDNARALFVPLLRAGGDPRTRLATVDTTHERR